jgi:hypothetical protein
MRYREAAKAGVPTHFRSNVRGKRNPSPHSASYALVVGIRIGSRMLITLPVERQNDCGWP